MIGEDLFSFYLFFLLSVWVGKEGRDGWMDGWIDGSMNEGGGWVGEGDSIV